MTVGAPSFPPPQHADFFWYGLGRQTLSFCSIPLSGHANAASGLQRTRTLSARLHDDPTRSTRHGSSPTPTAPGFGRAMEDRQQTKALPASLPPKSRRGSGYISAVPSSARGMA